ncbi:hypothetical protein AQUCO_00500354v1 [Aquilegia coerulea]|uniref:Enhancer of mRNA-decapping protein 4 WD40 repeat region domain-containing protein n=1 Tax=Aquilegia coerulea TaxID=218851 RepID=A0A2G5ERJ7_AQUCA|nr:hypothetical protein AQUCO_00500354v1 [Aquilegia coerulea]
MASAGNPNQQPGPFDVQKLFRQSPNPNSNLNVLPSPPPPLPLPSSSYPPPSSPFSYPTQTLHPHHYMPYPPPPPQDPSPPPPPNMHLQQRTLSYPTPPLQPPPQQQQQQHRSPNHNDGARLMALLGTTPSSDSSSPIPPPSSIQPSLPVFPSAPPANLATTQHSAPMRLLSTKQPKGRRLVGDHRVVYDVDVRNQGEVQPQLEVTPITKYVSDPSLVLGRQIAVNKSYICYGLKMGSIRVLNINTALRHLLKGHTQRVTDMAFFAEDVHFLASASVDGLVFVWKIDEGPDAEDKPQITGKVVIAIQMVGEGEPVHPRVCWHSHKQEFLVVGIGKRVLKIDTTKVGKGEVFSAEEPLKCSLDKLVDGIQLVGKHDGEVTDLSMCQWMTTRLVSASSDGMVKIWEDRKALPLAVLRPHDGQPVNSATFLTAPHSPEHIVLVTAGPLNREVKIWVSASEEGWLLPSDADSWKCTQTLDLKSSAETRAEEAFFNQVVALPCAGLILLANAKKNAIYAVHIEYGQCPAATRMDYIAEFTVTMPILSLTGTSESLPDGNHIVQVYCVQTQAIQQYALDLSQCLPPPLESMGLEKADSNANQTFGKSSSDRLPSLEASQGSVPTEIPVVSAAYKQHIVTNNESAPSARYPISSGVPDVSSLHDLSTLETKQNVVPSTVSDADSILVASPSVPLSPRLSGNLSGFRSPSNNFDPSSPLGIRPIEQQVLDYSADGRAETVPANISDSSLLDDNSRKAGTKKQNDISTVPIHLVTPSELNSGVSSSDNAQGLSGGEVSFQDLVNNNDLDSAEVEVKVGDSEKCQNDEFESQREAAIHVAEKKEKAFYSQASDLNIRMARECCSLSTEVHNADNSVVKEAFDISSNAGEEEFQDSSKDGLVSISESVSVNATHTPLSGTKVKKQKGKNVQVSGSSSTSPSPFNSTDSFIEPGNSTNLPPGSESSSSNIQALLETLVNQQIAMQKEIAEMQKQILAMQVKEGKRLETALGRCIEKTNKTNIDALWARFQEENMKHEKLERERTQQITSSIANSNKESAAILDRTLKKELAAVGQAVARQVTPAVEKSTSSAITESFQRGVGDKAVNQLEKSINTKLEATVARQIQVQFQTSGKQALQDGLKSCLEASVIPGFEMSCKSMFEQVDTAFQKGMIEHTTAAQQQLDSTQSTLALALREALNSATSITRTLSGEIADGQRKLLALATAGANSKAINPLATQLSNGPLGSLHEMVEAPMDPTKELSRLISERKFEEAFTGALQRSDVSIVSWLCSQVCFNFTCVYIAIDLRCRFFLHFSIFVFQKLVGVLNLVVG